MGLLPLAVVLKLSLAFLLRVFNDGEALFQAHTTHTVRQTPERPRRTEKIPKLPGAVYGRGIIVDMVMGVWAVYVKRQKRRACLSSSA